MTEKVLFAATIGNRDVKLDNNELRPARIQGEKALELVKKEPKRFSLPILLPALNAVKSPIARIFLIVTDQPSDYIDETHRANDTVFFGQIIKELLLQHFKTLGFKDKPAEKIEIISVSENPTILSTLLRSLQNSVLNKFLHWRDQGFSRLCLCTTGGVPSLNAAVTLLSDRAFKSGLNLLRVNEKGIVFPDPVSAELEKIELSSIIAKLSKDWNFKQIQMRIEESGINDEPFQQIALLCHAVSRRLVFDFKGAVELLSNEFASSGSLMPLFESQINEISALMQLDQTEKAREKLVLELILNIIFKFRQQEFVDVAGRVFRMLEEFAFMILEKIVGQKFPFTDNENGYPAFREYVENDRELLNHLFSQKIDYKRLNLFTAEKTLEFLFNSKNLSQEFKALIKEFLYVYNQLSNLKQLRNKSIIAHGFRSISIEDYPDNFIELVKKLGLLIGKEEPDKSLIVLTRKINEAVN